MPSPRREPVWLTPAIVLAMHGDLLEQHGGLAGVRDEGLVLSALSRPRYKWVHGERRDLFVCAAAYGFGIAKNHGFNDGNKRTAFQAMYTFLGLNGIDLLAPEPEAVSVMLALSDGSPSEAGLAKWLRANSKRRRLNGNRRS
jgi:death-on-curing protein